MGAGASGAHAAQAAAPSVTYVCPMHPEVRTEDPEARCPDCGMTLEAVKATPGAGATGEPENLEDPAAIAHWTCPMHPGVRAATQSPCPLCGMDLTAVTQGELATGAVTIDAVRRQQFGIATTVVQPRALTVSLELPGEVEWKEGALHDLTMRAEGWVERLYVTEAGATIERGDRVAQIYSPEMYGAQREFLAARDTARKVTKIERLRLLGLTSSQIREVERRGDGKDTFVLRSPASGTIIDFHDVVDGTHLPAGTRVARIGTLDEVRVAVLVHERDVARVAPGAAVTVLGPGGVTVRGEVTRLETWVDPVTRRARALVDVSNESRALLPGMTVRGQLAIELGARLAVPVTAVISTGLRDVVFVDAGEGRLVPRDVTLGARAGDHYEVVEGLTPGDAVVSAGTFLVASESKLSAAQTYWGRDHGER